MKQVLGAFEENKRALNLFFNALCLTEKEINESEITEDLKEKQILFSVQKSSFILMLYNIIESTVTNILIQINSVLVSYSSLLMYSDFDNDIRKLWIKLQIQNLTTAGKETRAQELSVLCDILCKTLEKPIDWKRNKDFINFEKVKGIYSASGNMDFRKIVSIFKEYNIDISRNNAPALSSIKDLRNKLAHGNLSFQSASSSKSMRDLEDDKNQVIRFLENLLGKSKEYHTSLEKKLRWKIDCR
ncbi:MAG: hypothetical protein IKU86_11255 [Thermoguttaceae bacterium]|nr:hypothetical protein [Thermoguttaceae bacterium]